MRSTSPSRRARSRKPSTDVSTAPSSCSTSASSRVPTFSMAGHQPLHQHAAHHGVLGRLARQRAHPFRPPAAAVLRRRRAVRGEPRLLERRHRVVVAGDEPGAVALVPVDRLLGAQARVVRIGVGDDLGEQRIERDHLAEIVRLSRSFNPRSSRSPTDACRRGCRCGRRRSPGWRRPPRRRVLFATTSCTGPALIQPPSPSRLIIRILPLTATSDAMYAPAPGAAALVHQRAGLGVETGERALVVGQIDAALVEQVRRHVGDALVVASTPRAAASAGWSSSAFSTLSG